MKHTPGPWHADESKSFYVFACGSLAEQANVKNGPFVANASTAANARLIAAAPDMLEALRGFVEWAELMGTDDRNSRLVAARAAIARATSKD